MSEQDVLIILGAARSGTKFLRDTLARADDAGAIDFDIGYIWSMYHPRSRHDMLDPALPTNAQIANIRKTILRYCTRLNNGIPPRVLIEKSVTNSLSPAFVKRVFPEARFIHLVRDGRATSRSAMKNWISPADTSHLKRKLRFVPPRQLGYVLRYGINEIARRITRAENGPKLWGPRYPGILDDTLSLPLHEVCALQWRHSVETIESFLAKQPMETFFQLRYEDLITAPKSIEDLIAFAEIQDKTSVLDYYNQTVIRGAGPNKSVGSMDPIEKRIHDICRETNLRFGYH
ncbi:sulfotransferase family protein [Celeribacter sp.]|uniref:sulfotransferase family protein n=1 Tax=Celeribacter sp. TaxID=1890673 RepID=UPI003A8E2E5E